ncbi:unnamed protein product [Calicophoron daubneyi]|uniref:SURF1-like protein n=1 Tax=Calicophoron daubneyi TaxID=300641 RepID=A0AAV2TVB2_CALDB
MLVTKSTRFIRLLSGKTVFIGRKRPNWKAYALLTLPITCFGLGYWQVRRRRWKLDLLDQINKNINSKPVPLTSDVTRSSDLAEYTPVSVRGRFDHSREILIGPRPLLTDFIPSPSRGNRSRVTSGSFTTDSGPLLLSQPQSNAFGYFIVTPFFLSGRPGTSILVNRGWVPANSRDPVTRPNGQIAGTVEVTGLVRYPEKPPPMRSVPTIHQCREAEKQRPQSQYYCRQIDGMAKELNTLPILIDASYESTVPGGPVGGQTRVNLRNEHASYIVTWWTLGAVGLGIWTYGFLL